MRRNIHRQSRWLYNCWPLKITMLNFELRMSNAEVLFTSAVRHSTFNIRYFSIRTRGKYILPYLSNCYCLTGRAGGSPYGLGGPRNSHPHRTCDNSAGSGRWAASPCHTPILTPPLRNCQTSNSSPAVMKLVSLQTRRVCPETQIRKTNNQYFL
jgi:hypothetical protein